MLQVQLLGEVAVVRDGRAVALSAPRRRLLAYLALNPGPHERDVLAARFWPDAPDTRANLRAAVSTLPAWRPRAREPTVATPCGPRAGPISPCPNNCAATGVQGASPCRARCRTSASCGNFLRPQAAVRPSACASTFPRPSRIASTGSAI